jgi:hypothetical protein
MARELVRHADHHHNVALSRLPGFTVVPADDDASGYRVVATAPELRSDASPFDFNLEIRHLVDDLRSALEFCTYDAHERFCSHLAGDNESVHRLVNFPVTRLGQGEGEFQRQLDLEKLGDLRSSRPAMIDVLRSAQPYASANGPWLPNLQVLWNEGKHRNFVYYSRNPNLAKID